VTLPPGALRSLLFRLLIQCSFTLLLAVAADADDDFDENPTQHRDALLLACMLPDEKMHASMILPGSPAPPSAQCWLQYQSAAGCGACYPQHAPSHGWSGPG
jgi:hypothetical protein